jgi:histidinol dehydrogenase
MLINDWGQLDAAARRALLRRPAQASSAQREQDVARLIAQVRADGDSTLRALTRRFDGVELAELAVSADEISAACASLAAELRSAIDAAYQRIRMFHSATQPLPVSVQTAPGVICERLPVAIERCGLYVPAGSAPLPSTALMLGVPAQLARVPQVVLCTPPRADGTVDPAVLYAASICGITRIFKLGGVQAIAAMAYGTESVPSCDKIFGPGNSWVTLAKQLVSRDIDGAAIDMPAGPSEVLVIADAQADPVFVAADLLAQAEHGPDSQVVLVSDSAALLAALPAELERQLSVLPRAELARQALSHSRLILSADIAEAIEISNQYAPEHLILNAAVPRAWLPRVRNAGSIFLGAWTPESLGDYNSGTNHVLPTYGYARAWSGVSVHSFVKLITVQSADPAGLQRIGPETVVLAQAEGLDAHARAVSLRLERLDMAGGVSA